MKAIRLYALFGLCFCFALAGFGQGQEQASVPSTPRSPDYRIGADDVIEVAVYEDPQLGGTSRVSGSGLIALPLLGSIQAAGLTPLELTQTVQDALRKTYLNDPHVVVSVKEYSSQPVNMLGAFRSPGIYQIKGEKRLMDMLAMVGGLNGASTAIQINRSRSSTGDSTNPQIISITSEDLFENALPQANIPIYAGDIVYALPPPEPIYLLGELIKPGTYEIRNGKNMTLGQAITISGGFTKEADKKKLTIIRYQENGARLEIPVSVDGKNLLQMATSNVELQPNDILVVPAHTNQAKRIGGRVVDAAVGVVTSRLIWRY